ncbi:MAG: DUF4178 domain-containing protein [Bacteroidota bacterium]
MFSKEYTCPACGAPIEQKRIGSRMLVCSYCAQTSFINADSLDAVGEKAPLLDYGSSFAIGKMGTYQDKEFMVLGRLRYEYEDGFWDEWYLNCFDGSTLWVQEDDGSFVVFYYEEELSYRLDYARTRVGSTVEITAEINNVFVTAKSKAHIQGGEGELPFRVIPGNQADFIDGIMQGKIVSAEFLPDENVVYVGEAVELEDLKLRA